MSKTTSGAQFERNILLNVLVCTPGMLRRWDDSQKYLSDNPHLVCEETANCLVVICIDLEIDEVSTVYCIIQDKTPTYSAGKVL